MKLSSMLTASMFTPMYSVEPCWTLGIKSTSRQGRGRLPSRLTTWLKERRDWDQTGRAEESSWRSVFYLWSSWVPSSPSVWIIRQCLRMAASLLNSAASSFTQHGEKKGTFWTLRGLLRTETASTAETKTLLFPSLQIKTRESRNVGVDALNLTELFCTSSTLRRPLSNVTLKRIFRTSMANSVCCRLSGGSSSSGTPSNPDLAASKVSGQHRPRTASSWFPGTRTGPEDVCFIGCRL